MRFRTAAFVVLAALLVALAGCKGAGADLGQEIISNIEEVVTQEATVAVDGAAVVGDLSPDTPAGLPIWPGATVVDSGAEGDAYSLTLTTTDSYDDVYAGVAAGFKDAGWGVESEETEEGGRMAVFTITTEGQEGFITITELAENSVQIDYVVVATV